MNLNNNQTNSDESHLYEVLRKKVDFIRGVVYIVLVCLIVETAVLISLSIFGSNYDTSFLNLGSSIKTPKASLYIVPNVAKYKVGDEFDINVLVNTNGNNVVVASAYMSYNKDKLEALSIDLTGSNFEMVADKKIIKDEGKVIITVGRPTPGVNTNKGKIAVVRFKALSPITPQSYDIYLDYTRGSSQYSTVILDDKKGSNILSSTQGTNIYVEE